MLGSLGKNFKKIVEIFLKLGKIFRKMLKKYSSTKKCRKKSRDIKKIFGKFENIRKIKIFEKFRSSSPFSVNPLSTYCNFPRRYCLHNHSYDYTLKLNLCISDYWHIETDPNYKTHRDQGRRNPHHVYSCSRNIRRISFLLANIDPFHPGRNGNHLADIFYTLKQTKKKIKHLSPGVVMCFIEKAFNASVRNRFTRFFYPQKTKTGR